VLYENPDSDDPHRFRQGEGVGPVVVEFDPAAFVEYLFHQTSGGHIGDLDVVDSKILRSCSCSCKFYLSHGSQASRRAESFKPSTVAGRSCAEKDLARILLLNDE